MVKLLPPLAYFTLSVFFLVGCGGEHRKHPSITYSGKTAMRVTHQVKNYADWLKVYKEVSDSNSWISVYVSPEDSNLVTVYELTESHEAAKKKFGSDEMRRTMKRAGVSSEPVITYFDIRYRVNQKSTKKFRAEITHDVADYDAWKKVFDEGVERRDKAGLEVRGIFSDADNPNLIGVVLAMDDPERLKSMLASHDFQKIKEEAGVASKEWVIILKVPPQN